MRRWFETNQIFCLLHHDCFRRHRSLKNYHSYYKFALIRKIISKFACKNGQSANDLRDMKTIKSNQIKIQM